LAKGKQKKSIPALISIKSEQRSVNAPIPDTIEFITSGSFSAVNNRYLISYEESELTGMDGTKTSLSVENGVVTVSRTGEFSSQMIFEKGQKHLCLYETPFGSVVIGINAQMIELKMDEHGGSLDIGYSLEVDNEIATHNRFTVKVSEAGGSTMQQ
jgi:uncharacterized beta-barrel protein YwiB (DUF1934 family)